MKKTHLLLFPLSLAIFSCSDDEKKPIDTLAPGIDITSPSPDSMYTSGQLIPIEAMISDYDKIKAVNVSITHDSIPGGGIYFDYEPMMGVFYVDTAVAITVADHADYLLKIEAEDVTGNKQSKTRNIHIMP